MRNSVADNVVMTGLRRTVRRLKYVILNVGFRSEIREMEFDGVKFRYLIGDTTSRDWMTRQTTLSEELKFVRDRVIRAGDTVIDCGAHHGFTSILYANWVGQGGAVVAVEASPVSCRLLDANVKLNGLQDRVTIENKAIASMAGSVRITGDSNSMVVPSPFLGSVPVRSSGIDEWASLRPKFIKVDIEGMELDALSGATRLLEQRVCWEIEIHGSILRTIHNRNPNEVISFFDPRVYDIWLQTSGDVEPQRYDGQDLESISANQVHLFALPKEFAGA